MELHYSKLIAAIFMFMMTFLVSMSPLLLVRRIQRYGPQYFRILSFLSCFGGGVFMGTCLLDLFPAVKMQMELIFQTLNVDSSFPIAEFLLGFGFLTVLVAEQIVHNCEEYGNSEVVSFASQQHSHGGSYQNYGAVNNGENEPIRENSILYDGHGDHPENVEPTLPEVALHQDQHSHSVLRSLFLLLALSVHSIFEGLAIGLQSSTQKVLQILVAVLIHKCIVAFMLGLEHIKNQFTASNIVKANGFFALTSPVGIVIGLVVVDLVSGVPMLVTSGILQGLAAGTFMYVTFFEILPIELKSSGDRLIKLGCVITGFSVICVLVLFLPD